jgi:thioredoxin 1
MSIVEEITTLDRFKEILTGEDDVPPQLVVIDFFGTWCPPCKMIAPHIDEFAKKYSDVKFCKINIETKDLKTVCDACEIKSIPSFFYFYETEYLDHIKGANKALIEEYIIKYRAGKKIEVQ